MSRLHRVVTPEASFSVAHSLVERLAAFMLLLATLQPAAGALVDGQYNDYGKFVVAAPERFIPLTRPTYVPVSDAKLADDEWVIGLKVKDDIRCFPIRLMWYHHVVNDEIGGKKLAVTYCIMANTAVVYEMPAVEPGLRAAGLFGGVLVLGRIGTDELWPQIANVPVPGNSTMPPLPLGPRPIITTFGKWKALHPPTKVLAPAPQFDLYYSAYDRKPKGYNVNPLMNETVAHRDTRLAPGEEVLGIAANGESKAYTLASLKKLGRVQDTVSSTPVTIVWDTALDTARVEEPFPGMWMRSYWYAWYSFYPKTALAGDPATPLREAPKP